MFKKYFIALLFMLTTNIVIFAQSTTIAVLPFTGLAQSQANLLADMLSAQLKNAGAYEIAPRTRAITAAFREQKIQREGLTDTLTISELGKGANARYAVSAHVQQIGNKKLISASIIDVELFRQISGDYFEYSTEKEVVDYMPILAKMLLYGMTTSNKDLPTLAIFPLTSENEAAETDRDILAQILSIELANAGKYAVVVRTSSLSNIMNELKIQREGFTDNATIAEVGKAINADYVLHGQVTKYGEGYINTSVVNVEKATLEVGAYTSYKEVEDIINVIPDLTYQLAKMSKKDFYMNKLNRLVYGYEGKDGIKEIKALLATGDINNKDEYGRTALMTASNFGYRKIVKVLIEVGANIHDKQNDGWTALILAWDLEIVKVLLAAGAYVDDENNNGETSLMFAAKNGYVEIVKKLIEAGIDINAKDNNYGYTALMLSSLHGYTEIVKLLIEAGANIDIRANDEGGTALIIASEDGHIEIVRMLIKAGTDIYARDNIVSNTALIRASYSGHTEIVKLLIAAGADVNAKNDYGATALSWATYNGHTQIVRLLKAAGATE